MQLRGNFLAVIKSRREKASQTSSVLVESDKIDGGGWFTDPQPERKYECRRWMKLWEERWGFSTQQFSGCCSAKAPLISLTLSSSWQMTWVKNSSLVVTISNRVFLQVSMMLGGTTQVHLHHTWIPWQRRGLSSTLPTPSPSVRPPERPYWQVPQWFSSE